MHEYIKPAVQELVRKARNSKGDKFAYIAGTAEEADKAWFWLTAVANDIDGHTVKKTDRCVTLDGVSIQVFNGSKPEWFRGMYFDGVMHTVEGNVLSTIIKPALMDRSGWLVKAK